MGADAARHDLAAAGSGLQRAIDLSDAAADRRARGAEDGIGVDPGDPRGAALGRALVAYKQFTMVPGTRRLDEFGLPPSKLRALPQIIGLLLGMRRRMRAVEHAVRGLTADARGRHDKPDWITSLAAAGLSDTELAVEVNHLYGAYNAIDYVVAAAVYELARRPELASELRARCWPCLRRRRADARTGSAAAADRCLHERDAACYR